MGEAKPWQIAVVVIGLLTLVGMVVWQCRSDQTVTFASDMYVLDIQTGNLYVDDMPKRKSVFFPLPDPETKNLLVPVVKDIGGKFIVEGQTLGSLRSKKTAVNGIDADGVLANQTPIRRDFIK